jgi:EAL domain-containing protein (putative c-di-GMP-specific phosphodiesterase class I)
MKAHQGQLEHMTHYDVLTALPNLALLALDDFGTGFSSLT